MKKTLLMIALCLPMWAAAQLVEVSSLKQIAVDQKDARLAGISADGSFVLITSSERTGLTKVNVATAEAQVISTEREAGLDPKISEDGKQILYRVQSTDAKTKKLYSSLVRHDATTKKATTIVSPSRELGNYTVKNNAVYAVNQKVMRKAPIQGKKQVNESPIMISTDHLKINITRNGQTTILTPNGTEEYYIWASLSPDNTKMSYTVAGKGLFVSDLDGKNVRFISKDLKDAKWLTNDILVGMEAENDGHQVTAAAIVLQKLDGTRQVLTDKSMIAHFPYPSADGKRIGFSTIDGKVYVMNLK